MSYPATNSGPNSPSSHEPSTAKPATAQRAAEVIAGQKVAFDPTAIPSVAYTDPEVAWAGLTEAVERGPLVRVLAVAQVGHLDETGVGLGGEGVHAAFRVAGREVIADRVVVLGDTVESGDGQFVTGFAVNAAIAVRKVM